MGHSRINKWATSWQNQQNGMCTQWRLGSAWASPSLIRVFAVRMKKAWVLSYPLRAQRRHWSDWANAQADLSLRWAHSHFVGFVMRQLKFICPQQRLGSAGTTAQFNQCLHGPLWGPHSFFMLTERTDHTMRICRLLLVFTGCLLVCKLLCPN